MGTNLPTPAPLRLRHLPLPARLVLSAFLLSVGCGYVVAMVQLHFQHASPGNLLPTKDDVIRVFHGPVGEKPKAKVQALLEADESLTFNGSGSMARAFTTKSEGWKDAIKEKAAAGMRRGQIDAAALKKAEEELRRERDTERLAFLDWVANGHSKAAYEKDSYCLPDSLAKQPIAEDCLVKDADDKVVEPRAVKLKSIIDNRCVACHTGGGAAGAARIGLTKYEELEKYVKVHETQAISESALVQSTHVHLLSLSILYGLTGLIFAFSSLPVLVRAVIAPLPLVAQLGDIACWWLTRLDVRFADGIIIAGGLVGAGLILHVVLGLFSMYGKTGKALIFLLLVAGGLGAWQAKERYIDPYIAAEKPSAAAEK